MKNTLLRIILISIVSQFVFSSCHAQQVNYPLNYYSHLSLEKAYSKIDTALTPTFKSVPESWLILDSVWAYADNETYYSVASEKLFYDHLINIDKGQLQVSVDLLGVQSIGFEMSDTTEYSDTTNFYHNSRGFLVRGSIGKDFSFESNFMENQVFTPIYLRDFINGRDVYPGGGRKKDFNNGGFDFAQSGGYLSYSPSEMVNIQFGHGKNFIGNGHRSLLLSDNTNNYPYLRASVKFWGNRINYHTTFATLSSFERLPEGDTPESRFKIKNASFHFIEFTPHPKLKLGLFESVMWKRYDDELGTLKFNYESINPVIFVNTLISSDSENKSLVGIDLAYQLLNNLKAYGQMIVDDNSKGFQFGLRSTDLILPDLYLMAEFNTVDPYVYSHEQHLQNYSHANQELAHPLGADFQELILRGTYFYKKRIFADVQINLSERGTDIIDDLGTTNNGGNIFLDNHEPRVSDVELRESVLNSSLTFGYMFNPQSNLNAYIRWVHRSSDLEYIHDNSFLRIGVKTSIFNNYDDF